MKIIFAKKHGDVSFSVLQNGIKQGFQNIPNVEIGWGNDPFLTDEGIDICLGIGTAFSHRPFWKIYKKPKIRIGYLIWECTGIPKQFYEDVKQLDYYLVPSGYLYDVFTKDCVPKDKCFIAAHGIDTEIFHLMQRNHLESFTTLNPIEPFTLLNIGVIQYRKGHDILLKAFTELSDEMPGQMRLIVLGRRLMGHRDSRYGSTIMEQYKYRRDIVWHDFYCDKKTLQALYCQADVYVAPHRGEGWGFPIMESMATGLPVITTGYSGNMEFCNKKNCHLINYKEVDVPETMKPLAGKWAEPDVENLKKLILECYYHRDKAIQLGIKASNEIIKKYSWQQSSKKLYDIFNNLLIQHCIKSSP